VTVVGSAPVQTTATSVVYKLAEATAKRAPRVGMLENFMVMEITKRLKRLLICRIKVGWKI
jgi:hypothetical protein